MGLIHLRTRIRGSLFVGTRLGVRGAVVGFKLAEESHRARLDDLGVVVCCFRRVGQPVKVLDDRVWVVVVVVQHGGGVFPLKPNQDLRPSLVAGGTKHVRCRSLVRR